MVFARTGTSPYTTRKPLGGTTPTQIQSPAIDAMRQTGTTMPTSPGGAATTAPAAGGNAVSAGGQPTQVPGINVQQVDTTRMDDAYGKQDATYQQMLADQQKMWDDTQYMIQQNFSGQMRRNASNAARMGLSLGGASYLSGQRSALNQAGNYARQANMDSMGQRIGIMGQQAGAYGQRAGAYGGVAGQNASAQNNANVAQWQRGNEIDDRIAAEQATQLANQAESNIATSLGSLKAAGVDVQGQRGATWARGSALYSAYNNAPPGSPEQAAALQQFQNYTNQVSQVAEAYKARTSGDSVRVNGKVYTDVKSLDDLLKRLEKEGYFG